MVKKSYSHFNLNSKIKINIKAYESEVKFSVIIFHYLGTLIILF